MIYYKTDFIRKDDDDLVNGLISHVIEMIQLQYGIQIDNKDYVLVLDDEEMDEFEKSSAISTVKAIFISQDVLLSSSQEQLLRDKKTYIVPDCYFDFELREAGELW